MRVLTVGNMYPPHHLGGYELMWRSSVEDLRHRGWEVRVLTADYRAPEPEASIADDPEAFRELRWYWRDHEFPPLGLRARLRLERHNLSTLSRHLEEFRPDVVTWWAMGGMSLSMVESVRRSGRAAAGVVVDDWMVYGPAVDGWSRAFRRRGRARLAEALTGIPTRIELGPAARWLFVSEVIRAHAIDAGWPPAESEVAHA